jgi:hypothetical protein
VGYGLSRHSKAWICARDRLVLSGFSRYIFAPLASPETIAFSGVSGVTLRMIGIEDLFLERYRRVSYRVKSGSAQSSITRSMDTCPSNSCSDLSLTTPKQMYPADDKVSSAQSSAVRSDSSIAICI